MSKWANYLISAVRFDQNGRHIDAVKYCEDYLTEVGPSLFMKREMFIEKLKSNDSFSTIHQGYESKIIKGSDVFIMQIDGEDFIKSAADSSGADVLRDLPTF